MSRTYRNKDGYKPESNSIWNVKGKGRHLKRQLSKARRRFNKMLIYFGKGKSPSHYESKVNCHKW